jgi:hypothetical protein
MGGTGFFSTLFLEVVMQRFFSAILVIFIFSMIYTPVFGSDFLFEGDISQPQFIFIEAGSLDHYIRETHERMARHLARVMIQSKGVDPKNLHFLSESPRPFELHEGLNEIDAGISEDNIRRVMKYAGQSPAAFIYLCGEGFSNYIVLKQGVKLFSRDLASWIGQFQANNVLVVIETAHPQDFLDDLNVNGGERIIKSAPANKDQENYYLEWGFQSFTGNFSSTLVFHNADGLHQSYTRAKNLMEKLGEQVPIGKVNDGEWGYTVEFQRSLRDLGELLFRAAPPPSPTGNPLSDAIFRLQQAAGLR